MMSEIPTLYGQYLKGHLFVWYLEKWRRVLTQRKLVRGKHRGKYVVRMTGGGAIKRVMAGEVSVREPDMAVADPLKNGKKK